MSENNRGDSAHDDYNDDDLIQAGGIPFNKGSGILWYFGEVPEDPDIVAEVESEPVRLFSEVAPELEDTGRGRTVKLYEAVRQIWAKDPDPGPQEWGDCVGWAYAGAVDVLACVEIVAGGTEAFTWQQRTSSETIYAFARVEGGTNDGSYGKGASTVRASKAVQKFGTLSRARVTQYDSGQEYDGGRAREWGARGVPDTLEPEARQHRVLSVARVRTFREARDAIANGYPVVIGSSQGFRTTRDDEGFALKQGSWSHAMKFIGARDDQRPGLLCMNSWGENNPRGPKGEHDIPKGCFWVDDEVCTKMLQTGAGYAISNFEGYPRRVEQLLSLMA